MLAAVFVAEIDDVHRFPGPDRLTCWAGLTPRHRESDTTVRRGPITRQGSKLVRWAAIEAISRQRGGTFLQADYHRIDKTTERRNNRNIARVAAARNFSPWCSTACATERSVAWPTPGESAHAARARARQLS